LSRKYGCNKVAYERGLYFGRWYSHLSPGLLAGHLSDAPLFDLNQLFRYGPSNLGFNT
jgi:hypothetical protein